MAERVPALYKVGQIVVLDSVKQQLPFRVLEVLWEQCEWFYRWNRNNAASEHMIRALTKEEMGL